MTIDQALIYLTECTLATVAHQTHLSRKSMSEYNRQIEIAQKGINAIVGNKLKTEIGSRVYRVIDVCNGDVKEWINVFL